MPHEADKDCKGFCCISGFRLPPASPTSTDHEGKARGSPLRARNPPPRLEQNLPARAKNARRCSPRFLNQRSQVREMVSAMAACLTLVGILLFCRQPHFQTDSRLIFRLQSQEIQCSSLLMSRILVVSVAELFFSLPSKCLAVSLCLSLCVSRSLKLLCVWQAWVSSLRCNLTLNLTHVTLWLKVLNQKGLEFSFSLSLCLSVSLSLCLCLSPSPTHIHMYTYKYI